MIRADLHMHSRYSDGYDTVEELINSCVDEKLTHIAITDHDNLDGYDEKKLLAQSAGLKLLKGLEISCVDKVSGKPVHLLAYNIQDDEPILRVCNPIKKNRNEKAFKQIKALQSLGYDITEEQAFEHAKGHIFKFHLFEILYLSNQVESQFPRVNEQYFKKGGLFFYSVEYADVVEAVKAVREAGGYSVIAHPNQQNNIDTIERVYSHGLNGIELNHKSNSPEYREIIKEYAKKYNLFLTGGSDYHGKFDRNPVKLGSQLCDESGLIMFG